MGRLVLKAGEPFGTIGPQSVTDVIGTAEGNEKVYVAVNGKANFDPSFNRGGDEIFIEGVAGSYSGVRSGSNLLITSEFGAAITIPAGATGAKLTFLDGSYLIGISNGSIMLGDQAMTNTAAKLTALGASVDQPPAAAALSFEADAAVVEDDRPSLVDQGAAELVWADSSVTPASPEPASSTRLYLPVEPVSLDPAVSSNLLFLA